MKDIIVSTKDDFIFKNKLYDEIAIKSVTKREIDLFIFEENILIKEFENIKKVKESVVEKIVKEEYGDESDILIHYEHDRKRKKLFLYSIGNGRKIKSLCSEVKELKVNPIQFYIKSIVENKMKKLQDYIVIIQLRDTVYALFIKENFIVKSLVLNKEDFLLRKELSDVKKGTSVVISKEDEKMIPEEIKCKLQIIFFEIGEVINEKIFKI